jgi:hypothetical protein
MIKKGIIATLFLSFPAVYSQAQPFLPLNDDFNFLIEKFVIPDTKFHSAIKPFNPGEIKFDTLPGYKIINYNFYLDEKNISFLPVIEGLFSNSIKKDNALSGSAGISFKARYGKSWNIQANFTESLNKFPDYINDKIDSNRVIPHFGRYNSKLGKFYNNVLITGLVQFSPKPYFSLAAGIDRHFIGDGYRSLLLSDNSAPYPFARITFMAWRLKYIFLYTFFKDINSYSGNTEFNEKHAVIHYLSYNVTDWLNLGFFEAIVWHGSDSIVHRGVEPNYINPMIFLRPVEFSLHSPDNANLAGTCKIRLWKRTFIYGQLFLDDLIVKQLFSNKGWWGDKYGIQAGLKSFNFLNFSNFYFQTEYNYARPYTYSHETSLSNYGNSYQPLAHPLGANFQEIVFLMRYQKNNWMITLKSVNALYGSDTSKVSYGGNIYKPYTYRNSDYDIFIGHGLKTKLFIYDLKFSYFILPKWNLCAIAGCNLIYRKNSVISKADNYFYLGISTLLYNNNNDY